MPAIPYTDTPVQDGAWNGPGNEAKIPNDAGAATLRKMYAWVDSSKDPDTKAAYKLPHHFVSGSTPGAASIGGVRAALQRVGQSGTQIPDSDVGAVKSHLQKHLDKYNKQKSSSQGDEDAGIVGVATVLETEGRIWAVCPDLIPTLASLHGRVMSADGLVELREARARTSAAVAPSGVAVVPLKGVLTPAVSLLSLLLGGGGGLAQFRQDFKSAVANPDVKAVVLDVDSPGGVVDQIPETAAMMRDLRDTKPVVAVANTQADSAAYWLASQAHEVVVTPSGSVGSIGVYRIHRDMSQAMADMGVKPTVLHAGKYKVEGNPYEPLDPEAASAMQEQINDYYDMFAKSVAAGRGVDSQEVADGFGQGRSLLAKRAVSAGMADRVATLEQTVSRLTSGRARVKQTSAEEAWPDSNDEEQSSGPVMYTPEERRRLAEVLAG